MGMKGLHNGKTCLLEEHPHQDPQLQLRSLPDYFLPYKTESFSAKRTLLKLRGEISGSEPDSTCFCKK